MAARTSYSSGTVCCHLARHRHPVGRTDNHADAYAGRPLALGNGGRNDLHGRRAVLPAGITGAVLPFVLLRVNSDVFWMLPGLWQIVFSLGVFASCRCLPRPMLLAGVWFLLSGLACVSFGGNRALAPVMMSVPYAVGMGYVAVVHYLLAKEGTIDEDKEC